MTTLPILILIAVVMFEALSLHVEAQSTTSSTMLGDLKVIPGERLGEVTLGISRQQLESRFGPRGGTGIALREFPMRWDWPAPHYGVLEPWFDHGAYAVTCASNQRIFAAFGGYVADFALNAGVSNLRVSRLTTPENLSPGASRYSEFTRVYGDPIAALPRFGNVRLPVHMFAQGLAVQPFQGRIGLLGVHNPDICNGKEVEGIYVPYVGRGNVKVAIATGRDSQGRPVGEDAKVVRATDQIVVALALRFPSLTRAVLLRLTCQVRAPGQIEFVLERDLRIEGGQSVHVADFVLGANHYKPPGMWTAFVSVGKYVFASTSFEVTP